MRDKTQGERWGKVGEGEYRGGGGGGVGGKENS